MLAWIITSAILIVMVLLIRKIFRGRISLRLQYGIWLLVLVRLLVPVNLLDTDVSVLNLFPWVQEFDGFSGGEDAANQEISARPGPSLQIPVQPINATDMSYNKNRDDVRPDLSQGSNEEPVGDMVEGTVMWQPVLTGIWIAGMAVAGAVLTGVNCSFARRLRRARKPMNTGEKEAALQGRKGLPVYVVSGLPSPCLFGLVHPAIYLPEGITDQQLPYILAHEESHYRGGDHIWSLLRSLCLVIHWYQPLVWLAAYVSRQDSELACDERTISRLGENSRSAYGRVLVDMTARRIPAADFLSCATTMTADGRSLRERVRLITHKPRMLAMTAGTVAVILVAVFCVACTGAHKEASGDSGSGSLQAGGEESERVSLSESAQDPADSREQDSAAVGKPDLAAGQTQEDDPGDTAGRAEENNTGTEPDDWDPGQDHTLSDNAYYRVIRESTIEDPYFTFTVPEEYVGQVSYGVLLGETEEGKRYLQNLTLFHIDSVEGNYEEEMHWSWRSLLYSGALCSYMWLGLPDMEGELEEIVSRSGTWDIREMDYILFSAYAWYGAVGSRLVQSNAAGTGAYFYSEPTDVQFDPDDADGYQECYGLLTQCRDSFTAKSFPYEELKEYSGEIPRWRQDFETALQIYSWFTRFGEAPTKGLESSSFAYRAYEDSDGALYGVTDIEGVSTMEELRRYINRYFSPEITDGLLSGRYPTAYDKEGKPPFIESNGVLYGLCGYLTEISYRDAQCQYMADFRERPTGEGGRMVQISAECRFWRASSEEPLYKILSYTMEEQADGHWRIVGDFELPISQMISEEAETGSLRYDRKEAAVSLQVFEKKDVAVVPEVAEYAFVDASEIGETQKIEGILPGLGEGVWYIITVDGIEYYYAKYDFEEDKEPELYGYSIIGDNYSLANGISVGLTKEEILREYPGMAVMDFEGNYLDGERAPMLGWNGTAYPRSDIGMDRDWSYDGEDYRWENQFDYVIIADIDLGTYDTLPVNVALLMKDDAVAAITFYYPTAN